MWLDATGVLRQSVARLPCGVPCTGSDQMTRQIYEVSSVEEHQAVNLEAQVQLLHLKFGEKPIVLGTIFCLVLWSDEDVDAMVFTNQTIGIKKHR